MQQRIGRYLVTGELGRGAMGVVYRAEDPAIGRTVAIKTVPVGDASAERWRREAQLAGALSHPNIVTIYDIHEEASAAYIFMEFVDGPTLEQVLAGHEPVSPGDAIEWLEQIAEALDFAHAKGIVHRDIKPANIMLKDRRLAKITDFGVAGLQSANSASTSGATMAGTLIGTPNYMAPEQVESSRVDGRADQFGLAVLAYEMLTGERPFVGESVASLMYKIVHDDPARASRINPTLAPEADEVLARALHKQPEQRYADCSSFIADLRDALGRKPGWHALPRGAGDSLPTLAPAVPTKSLRDLPAARPIEDREEVAAVARRRRWPLVAAVGLLLLTAAGGTAWWYLLRPVDVPPPPVAGKAPAAPPLAAPVTTPVPTPQPPTEETQPIEQKPVEQTPVEPAPDTPAGPALHAVQVQSRPPKASVTFDDSDRGCFTPCPFMLPPGPHRVTIALNGYRTETRSIQVPADSLVDVDLVALTGSVFVRTDPPGATVTVNGRPQNGRTPLRLTLPVGQHKIEVFLEGETKHEQVIDVREGALKTINIDWKKP